MRSHLPYICSLFVLWIWSPSTVAAQALEPKDTKPPLVLPKSAEPSKAIFLIDVQVKPKFITLPPGKVIVLNNVKPLDHTADTAHILIYQAPPSLDRNMILQTSRDFSSRMPTMKGLPPSSEDFRGVFTNIPAHP